MTDFFNSETLDSFERELLRKTEHLIAESDDETEVTHPVSLNEDDSASFSTMLASEDELFQLLNASTMSMSAISPRKKAPRHQNSAWKKGLHSPARRNLLRTTPRARSRLTDGLDLAIGNEDQKPKERPSRRDHEHTGHRTCKPRSHRRRGRSKDVSTIVKEENETRQSSTSTPESSPVSARSNCAGRRTARRSKSQPREATHSKSVNGRQNKTRSSRPNGQEQRSSSVGRRHHVSSKRRVEESRSLSRRSHTELRKPVLASITDSPPTLDYELVDEIGTGSSARSHETIANDDGGYSKTTLSEQTKLAALVSRRASTYIFEAAIAVNHPKERMLKVRDAAKGAAISTGHVVMHPQEAGQAVAAVANATASEVVEVMKGRLEAATGLNGRTIKGDDSLLPTQESDQPESDSGCQDTRARKSALSESSTVHSVEASLKSPRRLPPRPSVSQSSSGVSQIATSPGASSKKRRPRARHHEIGDDEDKKSSSPSSLRTRRLRCQLSMSLHSVGTEIAAASKSSGRVSLKERRNRAVRSGEQGSPGSSATLPRNSSHLQDLPSSRHITLPLSHSPVKASRSSGPRSVSGDVARDRGAIPASPGHLSRGKSDSEDDCDENWMHARSSRQDDILSFVKKKESEEGQTIDRKIVNESGHFPLPVGKGHRSWSGGEEVESPVKCKTVVDYNSQELVSRQLTSGSLVDRVNQVVEAPDRKKASSDFEKIRRDNERKNVSRGFPEKMPHRLVTSASGKPSTSWET